MSNKFLTEEDVSSYIPQKPSYYWFRIFLSINVYVATVLMILTPIFYLVFIDLFATPDVNVGTMLFGIIIFILYSMSTMLVLSSAIQGRTILFPFQQWICGLRKYQKDMYKWMEMSDQYETEMRAKQYIEKYRGYK